MNKNNLPDKQSNFLLYTGNDGKINVEVFLKDETVWLTQKAMAELFGVKIPAISKHLSNIFESGRVRMTTNNIFLHLKNIYKEKELDELATAEDFSVVHFEK